MAEPKVVNVEVHGQKYPIKTELDARYVEELAEFVEARMALAARSSPSSDAVGLADPDRAQHHRRVLPHQVRPDEQLGDPHRPRRGPREDGRPGARSRGITNERDLVYSLFVIQSFVYFFARQA